MSFEDDRTRQVRTGQAINLAIHIACNQLMGVDDEDAILSRAAKLLGPLVQFIDQAQEAALADARKAAVVTAFPGATLEPAARQQIPGVDPSADAFPHPSEYQYSGPVPPQTVTPTPVPGTGSDDW